MGRQKGGEAHVLIDGECVLCNRIVQFLIRHDRKGRLRFAALQSQYARSELASYGVSEVPEGTFVLVHCQSIFYRSDAALRVLGMLPFPWRLSIVFFVMPKFLRDPIYNLIARSRYRVFGKTSMCGLLTPAERARFLSDEELSGS